jgi:tripartite-type tricarboxylate transporter receptor subunit TctC
MANSKSKTMMGLTMVLAAGLTAGAMPATVLAQGKFPEKPVRVYVGYAAGGLPDTTARIVGQKLNDLWGQQMVIENRPSANGILAAELTAKAPPDGYTLLVTDSSTTAINPLIYAKLPYNVKDFVPVSLISKSPLFLAVHKSVTANSLKELLAMAKAEPGKLTYGSSGIGSIHHLSMEYLKSALGLDIVHVPYKGTGQSVPALVGGQVPMVFSAYPSLVSHAKAGAIKLLAANSEKRSGLAPDVPTIAEVAIPKYDFAPPIGVLAPAGTPREIINKLAADIASVVKQPDVAAKMVGLGIDPVGGTAEDYAAQLRADAERYAVAVKAAGLKAE